MGKEAAGRVGIRHEHESLLVQRRSNDGQQDGQEDEGVDGSKGNDSQIHAEVEDLKDFGLCKGQDQDATIGQRDARQDLYEERKKKIDNKMRNVSLSRHVVL